MSGPPPTEPAGAVQPSGPVRGRLFVLLQLALPQHRLSGMVYAATRVRTPWFKNLFARALICLILDKFSSVPAARDSAVAYQAP